MLGNWWTDSFQWCWYAVYSSACWATGGPTAFNDAGMLYIVVHDGLESSCGSAEAFRHIHLLSCIRRGGKMGQRSVRSSSQYWEPTRVQHGIPSTCIIQLCTCTLGLIQQHMLTRPTYIQYWQIGYPTLRRKALQRFPLLHGPRFTYLPWGSFRLPVSSNEDTSHNLTQLSSPPVDKYTQSCFNTWCAVFLNYCRWTVIHNSLRHTRYIQWAEKKDT